jgi:predicted DNA-binding antitoxin AbrB/MazE fold protein
MNQDFLAIYENGVLRPLTPLNLPEMAQVTGTLREDNGSAAHNTTTDADELRCQQAALDAMFTAVDKLPQSPRHDRLSGRDHDRILSSIPGPDSHGQFGDVIAMP